LAPLPAFLLYDWIIALGEEVRLFWTRRFTGASVLYFFIRYIGILAYGLISVFAPVRCALLIKVQAFFAIFAYIPWAVFAALRVLALSQMNRPLSILVLILSLASPAVNFMNFGYGLTGVNVLTTGCQGEDATPSYVTTMYVVTIVSRTTLILADLLVIAVTIRSTRRKGMRAFPFGPAPQSLGEVLLYDGQ
ncbi:hypothetical protein BD413DRAFT_481997, partial [Trametes elegans]